MKLTSYGHSCFCVTLSPGAGGTHLLFDPFLSSSPTAAAAGLKASAIHADFVLISHGHYDHIEDAVKILKRTGARALAGYEVCEWLQKKGVAADKVIPLNIGGSVQLPFGSVQMVTAVHSGTLPDGSSGGNPGGFVVRTEEGAFYYSGDTALTLDMQLIPLRGKLRFAVLCIGDTFTMGPADALEAAKFVGCKDVVGVHYDTWPPIAIDKKAAKALFSAAGKKLHLVEAGASVSFK